MHTNKKGIPTMFLILGKRTFFITLQKVSNTIYLLFLKEFLIRCLLHCTSAFSYLSLNLLLIKQIVEYRIIQMNISDDFKIIGKCSQQLRCILLYLNFLPSRL